MRLHVIVGSVREGRASMPVAQWAMERTQAHGEFSAELIDLKDWNLPILAFAKPPAMGEYEDDLQLGWARKIEQADAYLFVSPEYNHGYSPALKNALDFIYAEWGRKPAAFVTFGNAEGARGVEQLRLVLIELRMAPLNAAVHIRDVSKKIVGNVFCADKHDTGSIEHVLDELSWWASALKIARADA